MFFEINRKERNKRIHIVYFDNYKPGKIIPNKETTDNIIYAQPLNILEKPIKEEYNGYFKGKEGIMIVNKKKATCKSEYVNYSYDGKTFFNGYEKFENIDMHTGRLESNNTISGINTGKMELNLTINLSGYIVYDNKNMTSGYVEYNGKKITIEEIYIKE